MDGEGAGSWDPHAAAEGLEGEPEPSSAGFGESKIIRRLRNTHPNPPIEEVGSFGDLKLHWDKYGLRGMQKLGGIDDTEAWVDITKFLVGFILQLQSDDDTTTDTKQPESEGDRIDANDVDISQL